MNFQELPVTSKSFQDLPGPSKNFQDLPEPSRNFQDLPGTSRTFQKLPETSRNFQELLGTSKSFQSLPKLFLEYVAVTLPPPLASRSPRSLEHDHLQNRRKSNTWRIVSAMYSNCLARGR